MSESFVDAFRHAHLEGQRAFNEGEFERAFVGLAPDVEWHMHPSLLESGVVRGREAVIRYFRGVREGVDWRVEAQDFIEVGHLKVAVHQRGTAAGRTTGISGDRDFFQLWELSADGQVARVREFDTFEQAREAAFSPERGA